MEIIIAIIKTIIIARMLIIIMGKVFMEAKILIIIINLKIQIYLEMVTKKKILILLIQINLIIIKIIQKLKSLFHIMVK